MSGSATVDVQDATHPRWADHPLLSVGLYGVGIVLLHLLTWQATSHLELRTDIPRPPFAGDWFFGGWNLWDGEWYLRIADEGYSYTRGEQSTIAFFPGYPVIVRAVGRAVDNLSLGGMAVTAVSGLGAFVGFQRWCVRHLRSTTPLVPVLLLAVFPYAYYLYGTVYGDALFLLLALAAFLLVDRGHPVLAVVVAAAATATRLVGVGVAIGVALIVLERAGALSWRGIRLRVHPRRLRWAHLGLLLSFAGLAAWCWYLWRRFDDPLAFSTVQAAWGQGTGPRTWLKFELFSQLFAGDDLRHSFGCILQGVGAIAALLAVPAVARRFGHGYGAYVLVVVGLPSIGSQDFQGLGRYLLAAFPLFALVGERLAAAPALLRRVAIVSAVFLVFHTVLFVKGDYVA